MIPSELNKDRPLELLSQQVASLAETLAETQLTEQPKIFEELHLQVKKSLDITR